MGFFSSIMRASPPTLGPSLSDSDATVARRSTDIETTMANAVAHLTSARSAIEALALSSSKTLRATMALELARHSVSLALICLDECSDSMVSRA